MSRNSDTPASQPRQLFISGISYTLPLLLSASPFGLIFGALTEPAGLSMVAAFAMSVFVYAGASQFIAIGLVAGGAPLLVIWLTTFVVNLRHLLYAAALKEAVAHLSIAWRSLLAFGITDETYAAIVSRYGPEPRGPNLHWFFLGSWLAMYLNWLLWTAIGIYLGNQLPDIKQWGLEFAMAVTFIGIVFPLLKSKPYWLAAFSAGTLSLALAHWPYYLGLLFAALVGIALGFAWQQLTSRQSPGEQSQ